MKKILLILISGLTYIVCNGAVVSNLVDVSPYYNAEFNLLDLSHAGNKGIDLDKFDQFSINGRNIYSYNIEHLNLNSNQLIETPLGLSKLIHLKSLDLGSNKLKYIPNSIQHLINLKILRLNNNIIARIPNFIGELTQLERLVLYDNKIKKLPEAILDLKNLISLNLNNNKLTEVPEFIEKLPKLKVLLIRGNEITTEIPESLKHKTEDKTYQITI